MTTLKILWQEKQDMRRVQVVAVNQFLTERDNRVINDWNYLRVCDLQDYVNAVFPEIQQRDSEVLFYYTDDDNEQVRITNDAEMMEAFRLMEELAAKKGNSTTPVCKITLITKPGANNVPDSTTTEELKPAMGGEQKKKMMDLFVDLSKVVERWVTTSEEHAALKIELTSLLHEPGCQEALLEIMANPTYATLSEQISTSLHTGSSLSDALNSLSTTDLDGIAKILLMRCPQARVQIERVLQQVQRSYNLQHMSASDCFEAISLEESKISAADVEKTLSATFECDVTCPDGTVLMPQQPFDKVWKIKNSGPHAWPEGSELVCVGGDKMQAPESLYLPSVLSGSSIDISLRMVAPTVCGRYTGYWRLQSPQGILFGQRLWVDVNVMPAPVEADIQNNNSGSNEVRLDTPAELKVPADAPVVTESPPAPIAIPAPTPSKWEVQLQSLADMGFTDFERNEQLLEQHGGDLGAVISALV